VVKKEGRIEIKEYEVPPIADGDMHQENLTLLYEYWKAIIKKLA